MESRLVGASEHSWCRAVPGGTGITVAALLLSKQPDQQILQTALRKLQDAHPILRSKLHLDPSSRKFSFVTPSVSSLQVKSIDLRSTQAIVHASTGPISPFQMLVEHELNLNPWEIKPRSTLDGGSDLFEAKVYEMEAGRWTVAMKAHTAACDQAAAEALLREAVRLLSRGERAEVGITAKGVVKMGIEEYMPGGRQKKSLWARGVNMLGYSLNAFRLSNIDFVDTRSTRRTQLARLRLEPDATTRLLEGCKRREIEVCGALAAAALMGARRSKGAPQGQSEKYSVATLVDCRSLLEPPLTTHDVGFYHSAIVNTHDINGREQLWDLAKRAYNSFKAAKSANKHFSDMADLTFLMSRAIENPGLTPSSSLRTSFVSVFENVTLHRTHDDPDYEGVGVEDYVVTSSVHGVGPTLALFGMIRDGGLDCGCAYPGPLHSRDQIQGLLDHIKTILTEASYS